MNHTLLYTVPNTHDVDFLVDGNRVSIHSIAVRIDICTRQMILEIDPQIPIPTNAKKLEAILWHRGPPLEVYFDPHHTPWQAGLPLDMRLVHQKDFQTVLAHLSRIVARLGTPPPEK